MTVTPTAAKRNRITDFNPGCCAQWRRFENRAHGKLLSPCNDAWLQHAEGRTDHAGKMHPN
jgi:hypothetical protein